MNRTDTAHSIFNCHSGLGKAMELPEGFAQGFACPGWINSTMSPIWLLKKSVTAKDLEHLIDVFPRKRKFSSFESRRPYLNVLRHPSLPYREQIRSLAKLGWKKTYSESLLYWSEPLELCFVNGFSIEHGSVLDSRILREFFAMNRVNFKTNNAFHSTLEKMLRIAPKQHLITLIRGPRGNVVGSGLTSFRGNHAFLYCGSVSKAFRGRGLWQQLVAGRQAVTFAMGVRHWITTTVNDRIRDSARFRCIHETYTASCSCESACL